jgi:CBS domain containing-hemolysin-like protein
MYILLIILILFSAFFSGTETAFFSLSNIKLKKMISRKEKNAKLVAKLKSNPQRLLITILIGNNLANVAAASLATVIVADIFHSQVVGITTGIMTLVILIFGEITPKSISIKYNEKISRLTAKPLLLIERILLPIIWLFEKVYPRRGLRVPAITEEELRIMTSVGVEEGTVQKREAEIIKKVFQLNDITVEDVMTPRSEVYALEENRKLKSVKNKIINSPFSRMPIYGKSIDQITGILYKDDALIHLAKKGTDVILKRIAREAIFIPESKFIDELMREFQSRHIHMAVVVNEYGEVVGIVTLEDVIEELVGEIVDETDISEELIKRVDKKTILVHGTTEVKHINKFFNISLEERYITISGLLEDKLNRIPEIGQKLKLGNIVLEITDADKKTVKKVSITKK